MILFEWTGGRGRPLDGALTSFRAKLPVVQRAQLDAKTLVMENVDGFDQVPGLVGPIRDRGRRVPHVYKLQVGGKVRLRPLLCKGPLQADNHYAVITFLVGAKERDNRFQPRSAPAKAVERRIELITGRALRRQYETPPEDQAH
jgi:hypothetical protein